MMQTNSVIMIDKDLARMSAVITENQAKELFNIMISEENFVSKQQRGNE